MELLERHRQAPGSLIPVEQAAMIGHAESIGEVEEAATRRFHSLLDSSAQRALSAEEREELIHFAAALKLLAVFPR